MPDAPQCGDDKHSAVRREACEDRSSQKQHQAESGILDSGLNGQGSAVSFGHLERGAYPETDPECHKVVDKHNYEYVFDTFEEGLEISREGEDHHDDEKQNGKPLERLFQLFREIGEEVSEKDSECQRDSKQDEYGLEHVPEGDDECRDISGYICRVEVEVAPNVKVGWGEKDGQRGADGCKGD